MKDSNDRIVLKIDNCISLFKERLAKDDSLRNQHTRIKVNNFLILCISHVLYMDEADVLKKGSTSSTKARSYVWYVLRKELDLTFNQIGELYNTTAIHFVSKKIYEIGDELSSTNEQFENSKIIIAKLTNSIKEIF